MPRTLGPSGPWSKTTGAPCWLGPGHHAVARWLCGRGRGAKSSRAPGAGKTNRPSQKLTIHESTLGHAYMGTRIDITGILRTGGGGAVPHPALLLRPLVEADARIVRASR